MVNLIEKRKPHIHAFYKEKTKLLLSRGENKWHLRKKAGRRTLDMERRNIEVGEF